MQNYQLLKTPPESKTKQSSTKRTVISKYYEFIKDVLARWNGVSLSEIRDLITSEEEIDLQNNEAKMFLEESFGNQIQFCDSDKKNQSSFVFSSSVDIKDVINVLRSIDTIKWAANILQQSLFSVDFGLKDKFCDAEELKYGWRNTKVTDEFLTFFSELFNIKKAALSKNYCEYIDEREAEEKPENK